VAVQGLVEREWGGGVGARGGGGGGEEGEEADTARGRGHGDEEHPQVTRAHTPTRNIHKSRVPTPIHSKAHHCLAYACPLESTPLPSLRTHRQDLTKPTPRQCL
jgi:hypothetical protein